MRVNGYRCDNCEKEHLLEPTRIVQYNGEGLPDGWYVVHKDLNKGVARESEPLLFCCISCLYQWASNQMREVRS